MDTTPRQPLTHLLDAAGRGDGDAHARLFALIYDQLRSIARSQMARERPGHTLQPTALVHEAWLRLFGGDSPTFENRRHFFAASAKVMRQICIDDARKRNRLKRGRGEAPEELRDEPPIFDHDPAEVLAVDEALKRLEKRDARRAQVVTLRYFAGLSVDETAEALDVSPRTVDSEWRLARAWLHRELSKGDTGFKTK